MKKIFKTGEKIKYYPKNEEKNILNGIVIDPCIERQRVYSKKNGICFEPICLIQVSDQKIKIAQGTLVVKINIIEKKSKG